MSEIKPDEITKSIGQTPEQQAIIELSERVDAIESNAIDKDKVKILMQMSTILDRVEKLEKKINSNIIFNPIMGINCNYVNKATLEEPKHVVPFVDEAWYLGYYDDVEADNIGIRLQYNSELDLFIDSDGDEWKYAEKVDKYNHYDYYLKNEFYPVSDKPIKLED